MTEREKLRLQARAQSTELVKRLQTLLPVSGNQLSPIEIWDKYGVGKMGVFCDVMIDLLMGSEK